jgi:leucine dehydrogenase
MQLTEIKTPGYERVVKGEEGSMNAIIAIHHTRLGPALGGCRMRPYASEAEALEDVLRLSRGMSYKSAVAGLNLGGGKAVILSDPSKKTPEMLRAFGRFVNELGGRYITAEDVGTTVPDMMIVKEVTRWVTGLPLEHGGSGDPSPLTALGVFHGIKASMEFLGWGSSFESRTIAIQGVGKVGGPLAGMLKKAGAKLIVTDTTQERLDWAQSSLKAEIVTAEQIYTAPCDIFAPCALGAGLNEKTIPQLKCKIVSGAANNQLKEPAKDGKRLADRGILYVPDFVINAGGIINVSIEVDGNYDLEKAKQRVIKVGESVRHVLEKSKREGILPHEAADQVGDERLLTPARS